jgi:hypothetical protein
VNRIVRLISKGQPPKWSEHEAVAAWVGEVMRGGAMDDAEKRFLATGGCGASSTEILEAMEREAVEAALRGSFGLLADMLEQKSPFHRWEPGWKLSPEAIALIARRLRREPIAKPGRPKQTLERRRHNTPVHDAAAEFKAVERILRQHYPKEKKIRDRAISIAAARAGIKYDTLKDYLKKPDRHPL